MKARLLESIRPGALACAVALASGLAAQDPDAGTAAAERVATIVAGAQAVLDTFVGEGGVPGISAAIVLEDGSEALLCAGVADRVEGTALTTAHRFFSGSIGKTFFAALAMDLVREGKLDLDARVAEQLAAEHLADLPGADAWTVRHLLRHESGLPRYVFRPQFWSDLEANPHRSWTPGEQLAYVRGMPPVHAPGKGWAYSDTNYIVLGLLLEQTTGTSVYDEVAQRFLQPLELDQTEPAKSRALTGLAQGHTTMFRRFGLPEHMVTEDGFAIDPSFEWCGGGFVGTPRDLARWARALYSGAVLGEATTRRMVEGGAEAPGLGAGVTYGIGAMVRPTRIGTMLGHDGQFPGYASTMGYFPERRIAVAVQVNTDAAKVRGRTLVEIATDLAAVAGRD